jgi:arylsulfatase A
MNRPLALTLAILIPVLLGSAEGRSAGERPNILLIVVDDMSWNGPSCYGGKPWKTPHIDTLAEKGILFTQAYAAAPICSPTRASIMTGRNPARLGLTNWLPGWADKYLNPALIERPFQQFLPLAELTIAEALKSVGYATGMVGKWHLGESVDVSPDKQGFDYQYMISPGNTRTYFVEEAGQIAGFFDQDRQGRKFLADHFVDKALAWLSTPRSKPWFLYFSTHEVHKPITAKRENIERYSAQGLPAKGADSADYAAMHRQLDEAIGRLLDFVNSSGAAKNTLIVFLSDNGGREPQTDNTPFRGGKGELLEGGIRIPMVFQWNGRIAAGARNTLPVTTDDLFPTLLDLAGASPGSAGGIDGVSLKVVLTGMGQPLPPRKLFWHYPHYNGKTYGVPSSAIRDGDWKLIHLQADNTLELYNLADDVGERSNLASRHPETRDRLLGSLVEWRKGLKLEPLERNPRHDPSLPSGWPKELVQ